MSLINNNNTVFKIDSNSITCRLMQKCIVWQNNKLIELNEDTLKNKVQQSKCRIKFVIIINEIVVSEMCVSNDSQLHHKNRKKLF